MGLPPLPRTAALCRGHWRCTGLRADRTTHGRLRSHYRRPFCTRSGKITSRFVGSCLVAGGAFQTTRRHRVAKGELTSPPVSPPRPGPAHLCPSCPEHSPPRVAPHPAGALLPQPRRPLSIPCTHFRLLRSRRHIALVSPFITRPARENRGSGSPPEDGRSTGRAARRWGQEGMAREQGAHGHSRVPQGQPGAPHPGCEFSRLLLSRPGFGGPEVAPP